MALSFTVGGARGTFDGRFADEVACVLDNAFGAEGEWEGSPPLHYGELADAGWSELHAGLARRSGSRPFPTCRHSEKKGAAFICRPRFKPYRYHFQQVGRSSARAYSDCADELSELAECWELPLDDDGLHDLLRVARDPDDGWVAEPPEVMTFARLSLAANEAMRRDCPLWLVGQE